MDRHQADAPEQAAWPSPGERPSCPQWHFPGLSPFAYSRRRTNLSTVLLTLRGEAGVAQVQESVLILQQALLLWMLTIPFQRDYAESAFHFMA